MVKRVSENGSPSSSRDGFLSGSIPLYVAPDTMVVAAVSRNSIIGTRSFGLCFASHCVDGGLSFIIRKLPYLEFSLLAVCNWDCLIVLAYHSQATALCRWDLGAKDRFFILGEQGYFFAFLNPQTFQTHHKMPA